jgi:dipeptidase D
MQHLQPVSVWAHFATLCQIPRPSKHEAALRQHLIDWATSRGLPSQVDAAGNLLITKPASAGCEGAPAVALQAHLDMVCQKNAGSAHDFHQDAIQPVLQDDGWLKAPDTTLGADNGLGVAMMLAVLGDPHLVHGPIEALFTVDEEAGMGGAHGLNSQLLQARLMINLDTEEWGEFYLGCAGGADVDVTRPGQPDALTPHDVARTIAIRGLRGGHSGVNIHEERGNAIKLLVRVLHDLSHRDKSLRLITLQGGTARNALPREAFATVVVNQDHLSSLETSLTTWQHRLLKELQGVEEQLTLRVEPLAAGQAVHSTLSAADQAMWLNTLNAAPHGVYRMSQQVAGVVETSNNLGIVNIDPAQGHCNFMVRSLIDTGTQALADQIVSLFALSQTTATVSGHYPGWTPNPASPLLARCQEVYRAKHGEAAHVQVIHAGLECGIIAAKYPGIDIVSFGPTIRGAHAPGEAVEVASVAKTWDLLVGILARLTQ